MLHEVPETSRVRGLSADVRRVATGLYLLGRAPEITTFGQRG